MDSVPPKVSPGDAIRADAFNMLAEGLRGARVLPGPNTPGRQAGEGFCFDLPGDSPLLRQYQTWLPFPFGPLWENGIWFNGLVVTIYNPTARRFGDPQGTCPDYTADDATITISGNGAGQRIIWKWSEDGGIEFESTAQTNDPSDDSTYVRGVLMNLDVAANRIWFAKGGAKNAGRIIPLPLFTKPTT
jgi:hypothetical protein